MVQGRIVIERVTKKTMPKGEATHLGRRRPAIPTSMATRLVVHSPIAGEGLQKQGGGEVRSHCCWGWGDGRQVEENCYRLA